MIKAIIFDLDGVIVDLKDAHFEALNSALKSYGTEYMISREDHYSKFDGLPTLKKLEILNKEKGLHVGNFSDINDQKQKLTINYIIDNYMCDDMLCSLFNELKHSGYKIAVASNSVRNTIYTVLVRKELINYVDLIVSNQDVRLSKPNPEIYLNAISKLGLSPKECLVIEDSPYGIEAAKNSGANVMTVQSPSDVRLDTISEFIGNLQNVQRTKWHGKDWNILIPMAGAGSRFANAGYTFPKPLIEVNHKPMIQIVVDNLNIEANYIYIVRKEHYDQYNLKYLLNLLTPNCTIVQVDSLTDGAACTTLLAKEFIDNDKRLLIANSDQFVDWNSNRFYYTMENENLDGSMLTFTSTHPKWSYVKTDNNGFVTEVAEKKTISDIATVGIYYWKSGSDYVKYAEQMIDKNVRVNNEFYVCPVYNEAIVDDKKIKPYKIDEMWGLGTPEDLNYYLTMKQNDKSGK